MGADSGRSSLASRLALWVGLSTAASLVVFAVTAYAVVTVQEQLEPDGDAPEIIAREARAEVGQAMLLAGPIALVLAVAGVVIVTRRALRPLDQVIVAATSMTPRELGQRLPVPAADDEVQSLVLALNGLFARLEAGFGALGRFAGEASHELRTPLAVVGMELEVMLRGERTREDWERSARTCLDEVQHLTRLVESLLQMARAEGAGSEPVDLAEVITHVLGVLGPRARERGVALTAPEPGPSARPMVVGDADALTSALSSVVDNAIQYTPRGGAVVVSCLPEGSRLLLQVDDTGPGVDAAEIERIFEPFVRGAAGRAAPSGTGLGLAIARRIFDNHAATIAIVRSPAGGARFCIAFDAATG